MDSTYMETVFTGAKLACRIAGGIAGRQLTKMAIDAIVPDELTKLQEFGATFGGALVGGIVGGACADEAQKNVELIEQMYNKFVKKTENKEEEPVYEAA